MATTVLVRVPEETHIVVCRGKAVTRADHELILARDLPVLIEAHIMRHLEARFGSDAFSWVNSEDWRLFLQGGTVRIIVHPYVKDPSFSATLKRGDDLRVVYVNRQDVG